MTILILRIMKPFDYSIPNFTEKTVLFGRKGRLFPSQVQFNALRLNCHSARFVYNALLGALNFCANPDVKLPKNPRIKAFNLAVQQVFDNQKDKVIASFKLWRKQELHKQIGQYVKQFFGKPPKQLKPLPLIRFPSRFKLVLMVFANRVMFNKLLILLKNYFSFLQKNDSQVLQLSVYDFLNACLAFKQGKRGQPRFKSKRYTDLKCKLGNASQLTANNQLRISKIGQVKLRLTGVDWLNTTMKNFTITLRHGKVLVSALCEQTVLVKSQAVIPTAKNTVGLDLGITHFATLSDGIFLDFHRQKASRDYEYLANLQKRLAMKHKGSRRYFKLRKKIAKWYKRITNKRNALQWHYANLIVKLGFKFVIAEKLNIVAMTKRATEIGVKAKSGLNREILRLGWGGFLMKLNWVLQKVGGRLIQVDPKFSSQTCSHCGFISKENRLSQSEFHCKKCGHKLNADINAAKNLKVRGLNFATI